MRTIVVGSAVTGSGSLDGVHSDTAFVFAGAMSDRGCVRRFHDGVDSAFCSEFPCRNDHRIGVGLFEIPDVDEQRAVVVHLIKVVAAIADFNRSTEPSVDSQDQTSMCADATITPCIQSVNIDLPPELQTAALAALDARDHPGTSEAIVTAAATGRVQALGGSLSEAEMDALLEVTGWPVEWREEAKAIAWCESRYRPGAVGDGGNSLGLMQLWAGWFAPAGYSVEQAYDPTVNSHTALYVRTTRGRWGGGGGWSCAGLNGIE